MALALHNPVDSTTADYRHLVTQIDIAASPAQVWAVLTDFPAYPSWNPFIKSIEGRPDQEPRFRVRIQPPGQKAMDFRPKVVAWEAQKHFAWKSQWLMPGLFDGEHHFELQPLPNGHTRLIQHEYFSGILVPMMKKMLQTHTRQGFEALNLALKDRAERLASDTPISSSSSGQ